MKRFQKLRARLARRKAERNAIPFDGVGYAIQILGYNREPYILGIVTRVNVERNLGETTGSIEFEDYFTYEAKRRVR